MLWVSSHTDALVITGHTDVPPQRRLVHRVLQQGDWRDPDCDGWRVFRWKSTTPMEVVPPNRQVGLAQLPYAQPLPYPYSYNPNPNGRSNSRNSRGLQQVDGLEVAPPGDRKLAPNTGVRQTQPSLNVLPSHHLAGRRVVHVPGGSAGIREPPARPGAVRFWSDEPPRGTETSPRRWRQRPRRRAADPTRGGVNRNTRCTTPFSLHAMWYSATTQGQLGSPTQSNKQISGMYYSTYSSLVHT